MTTQWIKDAKGKIIAKIQTEPNGDMRISDPCGRVLGKYSKSTNLTTDIYGRVIARGECLTMLIGRQNTTEKKEI